MDCWDREKSTFLKACRDDDDLKRASVDKYVLDAAVLDAIDEDDRLIFWMGGTYSITLFVHQRAI
ncbi:MAG: hypothetical protein P8X74_23240 [Reinekea sp.]